MRGSIQKIKFFFILTLSFSVLSCMGSQSSLKPSASSNDNSTSSRSASNATNSDDDIEKNTKSLNAFLKGIYDFFVSGLYEILVSQDKTIEEKKEILKEFKDKIAGSVNEYEGFKASLESYKSLKEQEREDLNCETVSEESENFAKCESAQESIDKVDSQLEASESYVGCYLEKFDRFSPIIGLLLNNSQMTSNTIGPTFITLVYNEFGLSDIEDLGKCETPEGDGDT